MELATIEMEPAEAGRRLEEYRTELRRAHDDELESIARGFEALKEGTPVVNLSSCIDAGGCDELGLPRLAVARADRREVRAYGYNRVGWRWGSRAPEEGAIYFDAYSPDHTPSPEYDGLLIVRCGVDWTLDDQFRWKNSARVADVPIIPPAARRAAGGKTQLRHHLVLFEVDEWRSPSRRPVLRGDPFLLQPLGGEMYAVVAAWDVSELERAVVEAR